jgi:hypothetical protein
MQPGRPRDVPRLFTGLSDAAASYLFDLSRINPGALEQSGLGVPK